MCSSKKKTIHGALGDILKNTLVLGICFRSIKYHCKPPAMETLFFLCLLVPWIRLVVVAAEHFTVIISTGVALLCYYSFDAGEWRHAGNSVCPNNSSNQIADQPVCVCGMLWNHLFIPNPTTNRGAMYHHYRQRWDHHTIRTSILAALPPLPLAPFPRFPPQIDTLDRYDAAPAMAQYTRDQTNVHYRVMLMKQ